MIGLLLTDFSPQPKHLFPRDRERGFMLSDPRTKQENQSLRSQNVTLKRGQQSEEKRPKRRIGFEVRESRAKYGKKKK